MSKALSRSALRSSSACVRTFDYSWAAFLDFLLSGYPDGGAAAAFLAEPTGLTALAP